MSAVKCTWNESPTNPIDGYNVYLRKGTGNYVKQNTSVITTTSYTITGLEPGNYWAYEVAVRGNEESDPSNIESFTITFNNVYKPVNLSSTVAGSDVTLDWDYVPGVSAYNVYLDSVKQNTNLITSNSYEITGLSSATYEWYVSSVYDGSEIDSDTKEFTI